MLPLSFYFVALQYHRKLTQNTNDSLEKLNLIFVNPWNLEISLAESALLGSLRSFNNPKRIRVNVPVFCDETLENQKEHGFYSGPVRYNGQDINGKEHYTLLATVVMTVAIPQRTSSSYLLFSISS